MVFYFCFDYEVISVKNGDPHFPLAYGKWDQWDECGWENNLKQDSFPAQSTSLATGHLKA